MKRLICLLLAFSILLSCAGCSINVDGINESIQEKLEPVKKAGEVISDVIDFAANIIDFIKEKWDTYINPIIKSNPIKEEDGQYYMDGELITNVTIDIVAQSLYGKTFEECYPNMRKNAIAKYAEYKGVPAELTAFIKNTDARSFFINWNEWESLEDTITQTSTQFAHISLLGKAVKNDKIEGFFDGLSSAADSMGKVHQAVTVVFQLLELANNDINNPEKVCTDFINVLSTLAGHVDPTGYYSAALDVVSEGVTMLLKKVSKRYKMYDAYGESMDSDSVLIGDRWSIVAHPTRWAEMLIAEHNGEEAPEGMPYLTLERIQQFQKDLERITPKESELLGEYIAFRLRYKLDPDGFIEELTKNKSE